MAAVALVAVPVAQASFTVALPDGGVLPTAVSPQPLSEHSAKLAVHAPSPGVVADGLRYQSLARHYAQLPSPAGVKADGLRYQGLAHSYQQQVPAGTQASATGSGIDWSSAGIGAGVVGIVLLALVAVAVTTGRMRIAQPSA